MVQCCLVKRYFWITLKEWGSYCTIQLLWLVNSSKAVYWLKFCFFFIFLSIYCIHLYTSVHIHLYCFGLVVTRCIMSYSYQSCLLPRTCLHCAKQMFTDVSKAILDELGQISETVESCCLELCCMLLPRMCLSSWT